MLIIPVYATSTSLAYTETESPIQRNAQVMVEYVVHGTAVHRVAGGVGFAFAIRAVRLAGAIVLTRRDNRDTRRLQSRLSRSRRNRSCACVLQYLAFVIEISCCYLLHWAFYCTMITFFSDIGL